MKIDLIDLLISVAIVGFASLMFIGIKYTDEYYDNCRAVGGVPVKEHKSTNCWDNKTGGYLDIRI
mgnify:CR=1 FL=1